VYCLVNLARALERDKVGGLWYGNNPGSDTHDPGKGVVTVADDRLNDALQWIMRRAVVLSVKEGHYQDKGFCILYRLKTHDSAFAALRRERLARAKAAA